VYAVVNFGEKHKYTVGIAYSTSGTVSGPWKQMDEPLLAIHSASIGKSPLRDPNRTEG